jgi:aspartate kinase
MSRIASKFGGSSVADHNQFLKIQKIVKANPKRRIIIPSAPGKRHGGEAKLTDLLYLCHESAQKKVGLDGPFTLIRDRYLEIEAGLGLKAGMADALALLRRQIEEGASRDFVASRGEYLCGVLMAAFLGAILVRGIEGMLFGVLGNYWLMALGVIFVLTVVVAPRGLFGRFLALPLPGRLVIRQGSPPQEDWPSGKGRPGRKKVG